MNTGFRARGLAAWLLGALLAVIHPLPKPALADMIDQITEAGVIRIAVPTDLAPFGSVTAEGKLEGYDIDVAHLLANDLGVKLELVPVTSFDRIPALLTLRADLVIANLGVNPERARSIAFSSPYAPFLSGVYGAPEVTVKSAADLKGKKIAVTRNTIEDVELSKIAPEGAEIMRFDDNEATMSAFLSGQADLVATGNVVIAVIAKKNPARKVENKLTIKESPSSIGARRSEPDLLHWVNVFVFYRKLSGDLDRLSRKWLGEPLPPLPPL
jgi:polar amino acid transport system substrate-binding protein